MEPVQQEPAVVVGKVYDLVLWLLPKAEKLPRSYRFSVGERLVTGGLDLLQAVVEASYRTDKGPELDLASRRVNSLRYLLRLSKDLHLLPMNSYQFVSERLEEIGRMIGGWRRARNRA